MSAPPAMVETPPEESVAYRSGRGRDVAEADEARVLPSSGNSQRLSYLERAAEQQPTNLAVWTNLSAARLQAAGPENRPLFLLLALEAAEKARSLSPQSPEATYNLAIAYQRLGLQAPAGKMWRANLRMEKEARWRRAARRHQQQIAVLPVPKASGPLVTSSALALALDRVQGLQHVDPERHAAGLQYLDSRIDPKREPFLRGRLEALQGLLQSRRGRPAHALVDFRAALRSFERAGATDKSAHVQVLISEAYGELGLLNEAWPWVLRPLAQLSRYRQFRSYHNALSQAIYLLHLEGRVHLALPFHAEMLSNAEEWGLPTALAETYRERALTYTALSRDEEASQDLEKALNLAMSDWGLATRDRLLADIHLGRGRLSMSSDPSAALAWLRRAEQTYRDQQHSEGLLRTWTYQARSLRHLLLHDEAEEVLNEALAHVEQRWPHANEERFRLAYLEARQGLFDEAIAFHVIDRRDPVKAWTYSVRSVARDLLSKTTLEPENTLSHKLAALHPRRFADALPDNTILVQFSVLPDQVLSWSLSADGILHMRTSSVARSDLRDSVNMLRHAAQADHGNSADLYSLATQLGVLLLGDLMLELPPEARLLIAPDRELHRVPWGLLRPGNDLEELRTRHSVAILASSALLLTPPRERARPRKKRILAVGNPRFDEQLWPSLRNLPAAEREAREIAGLYLGESQVLAGKDATVPLVLKAMRTATTVHIAAHGLIGEGKEPFRLALAPDPKSGHDGLLTEQDLLGLDLGHVDVVYLAVCDSGAAFADGHREGVRGLVRPFLAAGARIVVASLWQVGDHSSLELARRFYSPELQRMAPALRLRAAHQSLDCAPRCADLAAFQIYRR